MKIKKRVLDQERTGTFKAIALNGLRAFLSTYIKFYDRALIKASKKPYKVVKLDTQLLVKHYKNGNIEATRLSQR